MEPVPESSTQNTQTIRAKVISIQEREITVEVFSSVHLQKLGKPPFKIGSVVARGSGTVKNEGSAHKRPLITYTVEDGQDVSRLAETHSYDLTYQKD
jgi:hypothetical protein